MKTETRTDKEFKDQCLVLTNKVMGLTLEIESCRLNGEFSKVKRLQDILTLTIGKGGESTQIKKTATNEVRNLIEHHTNDEGQIAKGPYIESMKKVIKLVSLSLQ